MLKTMTWKARDWIERLKHKLKFGLSSQEMQINLVSSRQDRWFDQAFKRHLDGMVYQYEVQSPRSGQWLVTVCVSDAPVKATVQASHKKYGGGLYDQIRRKTDVFLPCRGDSKSLYHPLGISYLDEDGRLRYRRVSKENEVPEDIRAQYRLDVYEHVAPYTKSRSLRRKLVVLISKDRPEQMAKLFVLEKINPLF